MDALVFFIEAMLRATAVFVTAVFLGGPEWPFLALLVVAAVIDVRQRRLPNPLAIALVLVAALVALHPALFRLLDWFHWGLTAPDPLWGDLARNLVAAAAVTALLVAVELVWRRLRREAGIGMGDAKLLFALVLADPVRGFAAFAGGLVLLGVGCLVLHRRNLPLIPFVVPLWAVGLAWWLYAFASQTMTG